MAYVGQYKAHTSNIQTTVIRVEVGNRKVERVGNLWMLWLETNSSVICESVRLTLVMSNLLIVTSVYGVCALWMINLLCRWFCLIGFFPVTIFGSWIFAWIFLVSPLHTEYNAFLRCGDHFYGFLYLVYQ